MPITPIPYKLKELPKDIIPLYNEKNDAYGIMIESEFVEIPFDLFHKLFKSGVAAKLLDESKKKEIKRGIDKAIKKDSSIIGYLGELRKLGFDRDVLAKFISITLDIPEEDKNVVEEIIKILVERVDSLQ